jgi:mRNA interferase RelE/StbE
LVFKESVSKDFREIPRQDVQRILERLESLRVEPRPPGSLKLSGKEYYRLCQGN